MLEPCDELTKVGDNPFSRASDHQPTRNNDIHERQLPPLLPLVTMRLPYDAEVDDPEKRLRILKALLKAGFGVDGRSQQRVASALVWAFTHSQRPSAEMISVLLEAGANVNHQFRRTLETPLHLPFAIETLNTSKLFSARTVMSQSGIARAGPRSRRQRSSWRARRD